MNGLFACAQTPQNLITCVFVIWWVYLSEHVEYTQTLAFSRKFSPNGKRKTKNLNQKSPKANYALCDGSRVCYMMLVPRPLCHPPYRSSIKLSTGNSLWWWRIDQRTDAVNIQNGKLLLCNRFGVESNLVVCCVVSLFGSLSPIQFHYSRAQYWFLFKYFGFFFLFLPVAHACVGVCICLSVWVCMHIHTQEMKP